jgi:hypothetical protein
MNRDDAPKDEDGDENGEDGDEDEPPRVLVAVMSDLGSRLPEPLRKGFGSRPIWFIRQDDEELVEIFDHLPEDPMPKGRAHELLRTLRLFAEDRSDRLQELLGVTDGIVYGFHGDANLSQVTSAFENDGFFVWTGILKNGEIEMPEA